MRNYRFLIFIFLPVILQSVYGQNSKVVWASKVLDFSSQYEQKTFSAEQALGRPNVLPQFYDSPCAWSPLNENDVESQFIKVGFPKAVNAVQIAIGESYNPGVITRIYVYGTDGKESQVYKNSNPTPGASGFVQASFPAQKVVAAKVVLNTSLVDGWNHIDAIGISSSPEEIKAEINLIEDIEFEEEPENLGTGINSRYDEIMPIISPDGKTLYFDRKNHPSNTAGKINDDIWVSRMDEDGFWEESENVGEPLNNDGHNFLSAITPDGNTILLGNVYEPDGSMSIGLSMSHRTTTSWQVPKKLKIVNYYNKNAFSEFHLGADGKTIVMTIEKNDSYGGKDLYVSFKRPDGLWSEPLNLGRDVNSADTELSPFLAADGKTLYFSSKGFSGYGANDLFMTRRMDESWQRWSEPQNLGPTLNSSEWDAYYSVPASGEYAYFTSVNLALGGTDIFRIKLPLEVRPDPVVLVQGKVLDENSGEPIEANIFYELLPSGEEVGVATSSPTTGEYKIVLPAGASYGIRASVEGYLSVNENMDLTDKKEYAEVNKDLFLVSMEVGVPVVMKNISFEPSSSKLTPASEPELLRIVTFLKEKSNVKIEIGGHTNNSCTETYCLQLSTERAKSVAEFLYRNGINRSQATFKGYGSRKPIASNNTSEGKRANRRVDFTITGM